MSLNTLKIKKITKLNQTARVYDLSVDETHNFFVGKRQIMTSNCDSISMEAMKALRNVLEEYSSTCRFQLTCNYLHKIIEPIRSRCQIVNLVPPIDGVLKRVTEILKREQIVVPPEQKPLLLDHIRKNLPDLRRIINDMQMFSVSGTLEIKNNQAATFAKDLVKRIISKEDMMKLRRDVIEGEKYFSSDYRNLLKMMFEEVYNTDLPYQQKGDILLIISGGMEKEAWVVDKEINFFSTILSFSRSIS